MEHSLDDIENIARDSEVPLHLCPFAEAALKAPFCNAREGIGLSAGSLDLGSEQDNMEPDPIAEHHGISETRREGRQWDRGLCVYLCIGQGAAGIRVPAEEG
eukprot:8602730-Pyramimonas_sp.AAC.1